MKKDVITITQENDIKDLIKVSIDLIYYAQNLAVSQVNFIQLITYYSLGKWIVDIQQEGNTRAKYGKSVILNLSNALSREFGRRYSVDTLENARKFYINYKERISETVFRKFAIKKSETVFRKLGNGLPFILPWSHYLQLMRIDNKDERSFYEIEAVKAGWSVRTLQRQYNSSL